MNLQEAFAQLGLPVDADERAVRRAYARLLKDIDQLAQPQEFIALRSAYERAMAYARGRLSLMCGPSTLRPSRRHQSHCR